MFVRSWNCFYSICIALQILVLTKITGNNSKRSKTQAAFARTGTNCNVKTMAVLYCSIILVFPLSCFFSPAFSWQLPQSRADSPVHQCLQPFSWCIFLVAPRGKKLDFLWRGLHFPWKASAKSCLITTFGTCKSDRTENLYHVCTYVRAQWL